MSDNRKTGLAIFSLVLGVLSIFALGFLAAIPGIITGHMAHSKARNSPSTHAGSGIAFTGLILSYLGLMLSIVVAWLIFNNPEFLESLKNMPKKAITD